MDAGTVEGAIVMRDLATQVIGRVDEAMAKLEKRLDSTGNGAKEFSSRIDKIGATLDKASSRLQSLGGGLTAAITLPLAGAGFAALKFSSDFERSMAQVVTLSNVAESQMQEMRRQVLALGPAVGKGPNELAKGLLVVTSTGLKGKEAIDVLTQAAKGSAVGLGEVNDVARAITSAINAYGKENLSAARAADVLFKTVQLGGAEANELAGVLGRVVGIASQVGVSFEEVGGFIATYTRLGVDAAEATTGIRAVLTTLLQPSKEAEVALQQLGTSVEDLRKKVREKGLNEALIELTQAAKGNEEALAAVFGNVRALAGVMGSAGSQAQGLRENMRELEGSTGVLDKAFARMKGTTAQTFNEFRAQAEAVSIAMGDRLAPALSKVLKAAEPVLNIIAKGIELFAALPGPVQATVLGFLALAAAAGPVAFTIGQILGVAGQLVTAYGALAKTTAVTTGLTAIRSGIVAVGTSAAASGALVAGLQAGLIGLGAAAVLIAIGATVDALHALEDAKKAVAQADAAGQRNADQVAKILGYQVASTREAEAALLAYSVALRGGNLESIKGIQVTTAVADAFDKGRTAFLGANKAVRTTVEGFAGLGKAAASTTPKVKDAVARLAEYTAILNKLEPATLKNIEAGLKMGDSVEKVATDAHVAVEVVKLYEERLKKAGDTARKAADQQEAFADAMNDIREATMKADQALDQFQLKEEAEEMVAELGVLAQQLQQVDNRFDEAFENRDALDETLAGIRAINQQFAEIFSKHPEGGLLKEVLGDPKEFGAQLGSIITSAFSGGGSVGKAIGGFLGGKLGDLGATLAKGLGGLLGGLANTILPGIGSLLGGLGLDKLLGKLFKTEQIEVNRIREAFVQSNGGLDALNKKAHDAGLTLTRLLKARNAEEYEAAVKEIEEAFRKVQERVQKLTGDLRKAAEEGRIIGRDLWEALLNDKNQEEVKAALADVFESSVDRAAEGFNKIASNFVTLVTGFQTGSEDLKRVLEEIEKKGKAAFAPEFLADLRAQLPTIGVLAEASFGALLAKGLSVVEALEVMGPGLATVRDVLAAAKVNADGFLGQILGWDKIVSKNKELFTILSGVDDMLVGLSNSGLLTQQSFDALAKILSTSFDTLISQGVDVDTALRLMQPQLQKLWEASETWNLKLDAGTQKLLEQAEASGLVGEQFKPAAERMVDGINTLIGRLDILIKHLGGDVPRAALTGAKGVEDAFNNIDPEVIVDVSYHYDDEGLKTRGRLPGEGGPELPEMGIGGIVTRATPLIAGEAGPEAIVPLDRLESWLERAGDGGGSGDLYVSLTFQAPVGATEEWMERTLPDVVMRGLDEIGGSARSRFDRMARRAR